MPLTLDLTVAQQKHPLDDHPFFEVARVYGHHFAREYGGAMPPKRLATLTRMLEDWDVGRVDPKGEDLAFFLGCMFILGEAQGRGRSLAKVGKMAAAHRSPKRLEIERLLLKGKTRAQVVRATGASDSTVKRVRGELVLAGRLPAKGHS